MLLCSPVAGSGFKGNWCYFVVIIAMAIAGLSTLSLCAYYNGARALHELVPRVAFFNPFQSIASSMMLTTMGKLDVAHVPHSALSTELRADTID